MEIYRYVADSGAYESLETSPEYREVMHRLADCKPIADTWRPLPVQPRWMLGRRGDFPSLQLHAPVFSERAWNELRPLIEFGVEALPLSYSSGTYFLIHVLDAVDCLDLSKTHFNVNEISGNITAVYDYAFNKELLVGKHMFKTPQSAGLEVLVSDTFKATVETNGLRGLTFTHLGWVLANLRYG